MRTSLTVVLLLLAVAFALAGCGGGDKVAITPTTITPTPNVSGATTTAPASPGATNSPSPSVTPSSTLTPQGVAPDSRQTGAITDAEIKTDILRRIGLQPNLLHNVHIVILVHDRVVGLYGKVGDAGQKSQIEHIATTERGVKKVISAIVVQPVNGY